MNTATEWNRDGSLSAARVSSQANASTLAALVGASLHALGTALRDAYARHRQRRRAYSLYNELRMLDDHSLRDLGIDRSEITSVASEAAGIAEQSRARFL